MTNNLDPQLWRQAKLLAARNYEIEISQDELTDGTQIFIVENPELPGCMAQGETLPDAVKALNEGRIDFIYFLLVDGLNVPTPQGKQTTTGTSMESVKISFTESPFNAETSIGQLSIGSDLQDTFPQVDDVDNIASIYVIDGNFVEHD